MAYKKTMDDKECVLEPVVGDDPFVPVTPVNMRKFHNRKKIDLYHMMREFRQYAEEDPLR